VVGKNSRDNVTKNGNLMRKTMRWCGLDVSQLLSNGRFLFTRWQILTHFCGYDDTDIFLWTRWQISTDFCGHDERQWEIFVDTMTLTYFCGHDDKYWRIVADTTTKIDRFLWAQWQTKADISWYDYTDTYLWTHWQIPTYFWLHYCGRDDRHWQTFVDTTTDFQVS
jgi:hypothetical protein